MQPTTTRPARTGLRLMSAAVAVLLGSAMVGASAHPTINIFSGAGWEASVDQVTWSPAVAPYPNAFTQPDRTQTQAQLMWAAPAGGAPADGTNGPDHVWFRYQFQLDDVGHNDWPTFNADIAADDWMRVLFNGTEIGTYLLPENKVNGQPVTKAVSFTPRTAGINEILIEAMDLGSSGCPPFACAGNEWVFFNGDPGNRPGGQSPFITPQAVPEPATLALVLTSGWLAAAAGRRRRR